MRRVSAIWASAVCLATLPATASTFVHISEPELVAKAEAVIQGHVVQVDAYWDQKGIIVTEALVAVEETVIGKAPAYVLVRTFGGQVGDLRIEAQGFPRFESGEELLLFLRSEPADDSIRVLGYQQGHFRVLTDENGVRVAVPTVDGGARYLTAAGRPALPAASVEIDRFKQRLKRTARDLGRLDVHP